MKNMKKFELAQIYFYLTTIEITWHVSEYKFIYLCFFETSFLKSFFWLTLEFFRTLQRKFKEGQEGGCIDFSGGTIVTKVVTKIDNKIDEKPKSTVIHVGTNDLTNYINPKLNGKETF